MLVDVSYAAERETETAAPSATETHDKKMGRIVMSEVLAWKETLRNFYMFLDQWINKSVRGT